MTPLDIERATIATWPARITEERDGWYFLAAGGVTGRVNAVWPLEWRGDAVEGAIDHAEAWCRAQNLPPRFKLTEGAYAPLDLPERLARRGYAQVMPTLVMTAPIRHDGGDSDIELSAKMPSLFEAALRDTAKDAEEFDERRNVALRAPQPATFAMAHVDGRVAAIGMSASSGALAGVFLMRTVPEVRRQGHARRILRALLGEAARWGATTAFLQVDADNAPAITLYEAAGLSVLTNYHFWRLAR